MSPSEFDLRAALRDGEGPDPDVDRIVAHGRAHRGRRRTQLLSAAAVVFVAAAGTGGALLIGNHRTPDSSAAADRADSANGQAAKASAAASSSTAHAAADATAATDPSGTTVPGDTAAPTGRPGVARRNVIAPCPTSFPRTLLPGGGSPGQFGSGGAMFARPVVSMVVCSYGSASRPLPTPGRLVLTDTDAASLARSLENASKTRSARPCPDTPGTGQYPLAFIGISASGTALRTVTTTLTVPTCGGQVTNGTAVRYDWRPPSGLEPILITLSPATTQVPIRPTGRVIGTPIHN